MGTRVHLVMPMAGRGSRFSKEGFHCPKPLIEIYGRPFFYWSTRSISKFVELASIEFVILQEHVNHFRIDQEILRWFPDAHLHILPDVTEGAVITCMHGISGIKDDLPVLFNDCDHLFKSSLFNQYCLDGVDENIDGLLLTFSSTENKYSFVEKDAAGNVIRTAEKEAISSEAICGCYYFRNAAVFTRAAEQYLKKCGYKEYFMSGVYNIMIFHSQCVTSMLTDYHVPFGVPEEYEAAKKRQEYRELI